MGIYELNMLAIKNDDNEWYDSIKNYEETACESTFESIESFAAYNGELYMKVRANNIEYRLNSMYAPSYEAERWGKQFQFHDADNIIIMYGLGNGYFVRELSEKLKDEGAIFVYEPCAEIFLQVLKKYDLLDILNNKRVFIGVQGINEFKFHITLKSKVSITNLRSQVICSHPSYETLFPKSLKTFYTQLKNSNENAVIEYNTLLHFANAKVNNTFCNLKYIKDSITLEELKDTFPKDIPVILVAAGPSVEESIEDLKKVNGRAIIIAADRILDYLLNHGIEPDFVASMDPKKKTTNFSKREHVSVPMFCTSQTKGEIMDKHVGKKIFCDLDDYFRDLYFQLTGIEFEIPIAGSVAIMAFTVALYLGAKDIILVGQDLAFSGDVTHVGGVISNPHGDQSTMVEGVNGEMVRSRYDWVAYLEWFEDMIKINKHVNVIDVKNNGAKIKGTTKMSLSEALDVYGKTNVDMKKILSDIPATFEREDYSKIKEYIENSIKEVEYIKRKSKEGSGLCSDVAYLMKLGDNRLREIDSKIEKISQINMDISERPIYLFMEELIVKSTNEKYTNVFHFEGDVENDTLRVIDTTGAMFEATIENINEIEPKLKEALELFTI